MTRQTVERHNVRLGEHEIVILATIPGFVADGTAVADALHELAPQQLGLGVPPEDMDALRALADHADPSSLIPDRPQASVVDEFHGAPGLEGIHDIGAGPEAEEGDEDSLFAAIDPVHAHLLELLQRFGPTRLPSPDLEAAFAWATSAGVDIVPLDMDDAAHSDAYIAKHRFIDVLRAGKRQQKLLSAQFEEAKDAHDLLRRFDAMQASMPSLQAVEAAREIAMAQGLRTMASLGNVVAVVPAVRAVGIIAALNTAPTV
jgi:hypothetical protein